MSSTTITITETGAQTTTILPSAQQTVTVSTAGGVAYNDSNARAAVSVVGGTGLSYNSTTGVVSYAQQNLALAKVSDAGTAASLAHGVAEGNLVRLVGVNGVTKLPALDGSLLTNISGVTPPTQGIANTNTVKIDSTSVANDEYARFTANGLESRATSEVLTDIGAFASSAVSTFGGTLIDDSDASAARTTLGLGTVATTAATAYASAIHAHSAANITSGELVVARGGTGSATAPMIGLVTAADGAAARTVLGVTNTGSYTGQIETAANKDYILDPAVATARTISAFYIKVNSGSGTVVAKLYNGSGLVKQVTASTSTANQESLANLSVAADAVLKLEFTSASATDVIFSVEYTE